MGLAKMFASCFVNALLAKGITVPPETVEGIKDTSLMSASTGMQPKASRIPALVPAFSTKVKLLAPSQSLPPFKNLDNRQMTLCAMSLASKYCQKDHGYSPSSQAILEVGVKTMMLGTLSRKKSAGAQSKA